MKMFWRIVLTLSAGYIMCHLTHNDASDYERSIFAMVFAIFLNLMIHNDNKKGAPNA